MSILSDDLTAIIDQYETNPRITEPQRAIWKRDGKVRPKAIRHRDLGTGQGCLRLLEELGHDGQPVGKHSAKAAEHYWDYGRSHVFPPTRVLVRFCIFMHLDLYHTVALVLKGEWEHSYGHDFKGWRPNEGAAFLDVLDESSEQDTREGGYRFNPDTHAIYDLLEEHGHVASKAGYTADSFDSLAQEMLLNELHRVPYGSKRPADFAATESHRLELIREGTPEQQQAFWLAKCAWTQLQVDLDEVSFRLESVRLKNAEVFRRWLCAFGKFELDLRTQVIRLQNLEDRFNLKKADPSLTREEVEHKVEEKEKLRQKELKDLEYETAIAPPLQEDLEGGVPIDAGEFKDYRKKCIKLLRKIKFLTHPDRWDCKAYRDLTDEQKEELKRILLEALEIDPEELGYPKGHVNHDMRSLEGLQRILWRVETILENAGLEVNVDLVVRGDTLAGQLEWLESDLGRLEQDIEFAKSQLLVLVNDPDVARKRQILACEESHEKIQADMKKDAEKHQREADELEAALEKEFQKRIGS